MVDLECKSKRVTKTPEQIQPNKKSPRAASNNMLHILLPTPFCGGADITPASETACSAYENYLQLTELKRLWNSINFPGWKSESLLKPTLHALEITFRFISTVLSDPRPYSNRREWTRRLESLASSQIEIIATVIERDDGNTTMVPICNSESRVGTAMVVNRTSIASLLPQLLTWQKSCHVARKILNSIECQTKNCPCTLGLGEPNLTNKPSLAYDLVCTPNEVLRLKTDKKDNCENRILHSMYQILESWIQASHELLKCIIEKIELRTFSSAADDCYLLERIWKLLSEIEDLHLLMDPEDALKLKTEFEIWSETAPFCFRSRGLVSITKQCRDLKHKVPFIINVKVDPKGGPRVQEAAMKLYSEKRESEKIHLLQALQAVEAAMKRFYYGYKQMLVVVLGSLEAKANRVLVSLEGDDSLSQVYLEPTYFPSLDAAKTFLGESLRHEFGGSTRSST